MYEYEEPRGDDYQSDRDRLADDEYLLSLDARERVRLDRLAEHVTPDPKPAKRVKRSEVPSPDETWRESVFERDGYACAVHANPAFCEWPPAAHHVVLAQILRRERHHALYIRAAGMTVCSLAHRQHHNRIRPIRFEEIPAECVALAVELGYGDWLEKHYPREATAA